MADRGTLPTMAIDIGSPWRRGWSGLAPAAPIRQTWETMQRTTIYSTRANIDDDGDEHIRRIVRQEMADIMAIDVPDHPPTDVA